MAFNKKHLLSKNTRLVKMQDNFGKKNHVPSPAANPRNVRSVVPENFPKKGVRMGLRDLRDAKAGGRHKEHGESAEGVERYEPLWKRGGAGEVTHGCVSGGNRV